VGTLADLQKQGKIRHVGLSNVTPEQLKTAQSIVPIASIQNRYNLTDRENESVLKASEEAGIAFIPWFPLATGDLAKPGSQLDTIAKAHDAAPSQIALAWLLRHSSAMLPIPGTSSVAHLEENMAAARIELSDDEYKQIDALAGGQ
jgi:aryl-alcohol dehydrogenase-like predicted oxidoreductase